jgi:hypothetical protein
MFDQTQRADELAWKPEIADWEVLDGALSLSAIEHIRRNTDLTHRVSFNPIV